MNTMRLTTLDINILINVQEKREIDINDMSGMLRNEAEKLEKEGYLKSEFYDGLLGYESIIFKITKKGKEEIEKQKQKYTKRGHHVNIYIPSDDDEVRLRV